MNTLIPVTARLHDSATESDTAPSPVAGATRIARPRNDDPPIGRRRLQFARPRNERCLTSYLILLPGFFIAQQATTRVRRGASSK